MQRLRWTALGFALAIGCVVLMGLRGYKTVDNTLVYSTPVVLPKEMLRDYFAAQALCGILGNAHVMRSKVETNVRLAWKYADEMIKQRGN